MTNFISVTTKLLTCMLLLLALRAMSHQKLHWPSHTKAADYQLDSSQQVHANIQYTLPGIDQLVTMHLNELINAIIYVESRNNARAYNKSSGAVGCMQLMPVMVHEVNRICKIHGIQKTYTLQDRWSCEKSKHMFCIWHRFHHSNSSNERIARHWWGGPKWGEADISIAYWEKVKKRLDV